MTKLVFRYLDVRPVGAVCGRGGVLRVYMLANNIPFQEELVTFQEWRSGEKARTKSELNPGGYLPAVKMNDKWYSEMIAIARYLGRQNGLYGEDPETDYEVDALCDAYQVWRNTYATALGETPDSEKFIAYQNKRQHFYECLEALYKARTSKEGAYITGGELPSFADSAAFAMVNDDQEVFGKYAVESYPNLLAVHDAVASVPSVKSWLESWRQRSDF